MLQQANDLSKVNISVIVPVYCVQEELLRSCLTSLQKQDYEAVEFLIIDDGSKDESGRICDEYAAQDGRFRVIHKENGGVSSARNRGLELAQGEYILFVDGDDSVPGDLCSKCTAFMHEHETDFVMFSYRKTSGRNNKEAGGWKEKELTGEALEALTKSVVSHIDLHDGFFAGPPWGKIFKRKIVETGHICFAEGVKRSEDRLFVYDYLVHCRTGYLYNYVGYYYVDDNPASATNNYDPGIISVLDRTTDEFKTRLTVDGRVKQGYEFAYKSLYLRSLITMFRLYFGNKNCPLSMRERRAELIRILSLSDYKDALSVMEKASLGKRRSIILYLVKLRMYCTALRLSETLLSRK